MSNINTSDSIDACMAMKWAIVASIPDSALVPQVQSFGSWLSGEISNESKKLGVQVLLDTVPTITIPVVPGDIGGVASAYEKIHHDHPSVLLVVHILPHNESDEYHWMKSLAARYGLVRQGVLAENAFTHFRDADKVTVLRNIIQWIARRSAEIARGKAGSERPFDLRIGTDEDAVRVLKRPINDTLVQASVTGILHGTTTAGDDASSVRVAGLPLGLGEFAIASIFKDLTVCGVCLNADEAVVTLANKFHAYQAAALYDGHKFDRYHTIRVVPTSQMIVQMGGC